MLSVTDIYRVSRELFELFVVLSTTVDVLFGVVHLCMSCIQFP